MVPLTARRIIKWNRRNPCTPQHTNCRLSLESRPWQPGKFFYGSRQTSCFLAVCAGIVQCMIFSMNIHTVHMTPTLTPTHYIEVFINIPMHGWIHAIHAIVHSKSRKLLVFLFFHRVSVLGPRWTRYTRGWLHGTLKYCNLSNV